MWMEVESRDSILEGEQSPRVQRLWNGRPILKRAPATSRILPRTLGQVSGHRVSAEGFQ